MEQRIDLRPNCSLTPVTAMLFFGSVCAVSLPVSLYFSWAGFWPVLLFWVLEMLLLALALQHSMRRRLDMQTVLITDERIQLLTRSRKGEAQQEFARHWAKVRLRSPRTSHHPSRLTIESHGRSCEVGSFLTEQERRSLAERLRTMVGGPNESPPLDENRS